MKISYVQNIDINSVLDEFFVINKVVEPWLKIIYLLMFQKGVASFDIDEKHLEIYVKNGALNIIYSTVQQ